MAGQRCEGYVRVMYTQYNIARIRAYVTYRRSLDRQRCSKLDVRGILHLSQNSIFTNFFRFGPVTQLGTPIVLLTHYIHNLWQNVRGDSFLCFGYFLKMEALTHYIHNLWQNVRGGLLFMLWIFPRSELLTGLRH